MRFFTALLVLSAASITVAHHARQCAVCPEIVYGQDSGNIYFGTPPSPDAENTTLCGYIEQSNPDDQAFCSYHNDTGRLVDTSGNVNCPDQVGMVECDGY
ncbi:hypothetical protein DFH08DRAFT_894735 [Mycena albidolilacea]|uniref:Uncharacterized protein n=1 Tax=Mycena albidolilacea TaxID=1033008 RepID=A0AAD6ZB47_9AGAR|nr:hypothetical protein DFH08DRAFT_894735 [Mycena albidolilacea]